MSKKCVKNLYATIVSESEWSDWQECPTWTPFRAVFSVKQLASRKCKCFDKIQLIMPRASEGRSFFAVFELPQGSKYKKGTGVPFYLTTGMLALKEDDAVLLRTRYGNETCSVGVIGTSAQTALDNALQRVAIAAARESGVRLLEIFDIPVREDGVFPINCIVSSSPSSDEFRVLGYTRHSPNFPEGLLGAVCDIGAILRSTESVDKTPVSLLAAKVSEMIKSGSSFDFGSAQRLVGEFSSLHPLMRMDILVFLYWKYRAGLLDGRIDFAEIERNLVSARELGVEEVCYRALVTLGQLSGFDCFALDYHSAMREKMKKALL